MNNCPECKSINTKGVERTTIGRSPLSIIELWICHSCGHSFKVQVAIPFNTDTDATLEDVLRDMAGCPVIVTEDIKAPTG